MTVILILSFLMSEAMRISCFSLHDVFLSLSLERENTTDVTDYGPDLTILVATAMALNLHVSSFNLECAEREREITRL